MKKAESAFDYRPRRPVAIQRAAERAREQRLERVTFDQKVDRKYYYPLFEVIAGGKSVEWTDKRGQAHAVFNGCDTLPKSLTVIYEDGRRITLNEVNALGQEACKTS